MRPTKRWTRYLTLWLMLFMIGCATEVEGTDPPQPGTKTIAPIYDLDGNLTNERIDLPPKINKEDYVDT